MTADAVRATPGWLLLRETGDAVARQSPRRLGAAQSAHAIEWLTGWLGAARERRPELSTVALIAPESRAAAGPARGAVRVDRIQVDGMP